MNIYLDFIGCRLNQAEIEQMARRFAAAGHTVVAAPEAADLIVLNTCAVTNEAARDSRQRVRVLNAASPQARIVATGCWATLAPAEAAALPGVWRVVENAGKDALTSHAWPLPPLAKPPDGDGWAGAGPFGLSLRTKPFGLSALGAKPERSRRGEGQVRREGRAHRRTRLFVKVQDGCDNHCTFCVTRIARGPGRSRPPAEVIAEVQSAVEAGVREVLLTGVHLGSYGHDLGNRQGLFGLVRRLLRETGIERVRLSSLEPWDLTPEFFALWEDPRLCRHLHLPLQSGCATTLRRMARRTTPTQFASLVEAARRAIPDVAVTSDVIVGFPGEDEQEFAASLEVVGALEFAGLHVFKYSPREGTVAARMKAQVPEAEKRARSRRLREVGAQSARRYRQRFIGRRLPVLWEGASGTHPEGPVWVGRTDNALRVTTVSARPLWNTITEPVLTQMCADGMIASHIVFP